MTGPDREIDARGLLCPLPVLRAARVLRGLPPGSMLAILADDPAAVVDMPHFCGQAGHDFVAVTEVEGAQRYLIRRGLT